jgi:hypothetical protein
MDCEVNLDRFFFIFYFILVSIVLKQGYHNWKIKAEGTVGLTTSSKWPTTSDSALFCILVKISDKQYKSKIVLFKNRNYIYQPMIIDQDCIEWKNAF